MKDTVSTITLQMHLVERIIVVMGMDYRYSGSAAYARFSEELCNIAEVFGAIKSTDFDALTFYKVWDDCRFAFPVKTPKILAIWFNDVYGVRHKYTVIETKEIWKLVCQHPEIKDISQQIWHELECCAEYDACWGIEH